MLVPVHLSIIKQSIHPFYRFCRSYLSLEGKSKNGMRWQVSLCYAWIPGARLMPCLAMAYYSINVDSHSPESSCGMHVPRYRNRSSTSTGWDDGPTMDHLLSTIAAGRATIPEQELHGTLSFDEMKIQSGLIYDMKTGLLAGFTETSPLTEYENLKGMMKEDPDLMPPVEQLTGSLATRGGGQRGTSGRSAAACDPSNIPGLTSWFLGSVRATYSAPHGRLQQPAAAPRPQPGHTAHAQPRHAAHAQPGHAAHP